MRTFHDSRRHLVTHCKYTVFFLASAALAGTPALADAQKRGKGEAKTRIYVVQPGDSCWSIALRIFGKGKKYRLIHRYNDLGPLPHILKPGQELRLPGAGSSPEARVAWLRKEVRAKAPAMVDWLKAREDMGLWRLYKVTTGAGSSAGIRFEDQSSLKMREKALLVIYGGAATRARVRGKPTNTVVVERGAVRGGLARLDQRADLLLKTPSAEVKVRSRSTQVEVDAAESSLVSVYDGKAQVKAQGSTVEVPEDFGTRVQLGKKPEKPRRLPTPPRWDVQSGDRVVVVPRGQLAELRGSWASVKGARKYRVELARDPEFRFPVLKAVVGAGVRRFAAKERKPGEYYSRVAAIDRAGLEGRASRVIKAEVLEVTGSRRLVPDGRDYEAAGLVQLDLPEALAARVEVRVGGQGAFSPGTTPVRLSRPGLYQVNYRLRGARATSTLRVRVLAVGGALKVQGPLAVEGPGLPVELTLLDEKERPVALPGVQLTAYPGGDLPLTTGAAGRLSATLPAPNKYEVQAVVLVASWPGGELARAEVPVKAPEVTASAPAPAPAPPPAPEFRWPAEPATLEGPRQGPTLPSRAARPRSALGLSAFAAQSDPATGEPEVHLRFAARGELALLSGALGLDLDLPFFQFNAEHDLAGGSDLGDLRVGAKYLLNLNDSVVLSPSLRVTAPTGGQARERHGTVLEPALILEWAPLDALTVGSNQVLAVDLAPDHDAGLYYGGSYYAVLSVWKLSLTAELDSVLGLLEPGDGQAPRAVGAAGALRLHLGRLRLGVAGGGGINEDGRRMMGRFSVGLLADLGFLWP